MKESQLAEPDLATEVSGGRDLKSLEGSLQTLWERARKVSELVLRLKRENQTLRQEVQDLQTTHAALKRELESGRQELQKVQQQLLQLQSNGSNIFTKEEKEALKARIKELIVKINSRL